MKVCSLRVVILLFIYFHFLRVGRNEVQSLSWRPREILFEDRTPSHVDHVGHGPERCTTAAVGLLIKSNIYGRQVERKKERGEEKGSHTCRSLH